MMSLDGQALVQEAVLDWLGAQDPARLQAQAEAGADIVDHLLAEYRVWVPMIRFLLPPAARQAVAAMGDREFRDLLRAALRQHPPQGAVCWAHEAWFLDQCARVRDALLSRAGEAVDHG